MFATFHRLAWSTAAALAPLDLGERLYGQNRASVTLVNLGGGDASGKRGGDPCWVDVVAVRWRCEERERVVTRDFELSCVHVLVGGAGHPGRLHVRRLEGQEREDMVDDPF